MTRFDQLHALQRKQANATEWRVLRMICVIAAIGSIMAALIA